MVYDIPTKNGGGVTVSLIGVTQQFEHIMSNN